MHQIVEYVRNNGGIRSKGSSQNNVIGHRGCLDHIKIYVDAEGDGTTKHEIKVSVVKFSFCREFQKLFQAKQKWGDAVLIHCSHTYEGLVTLDEHYY